MTSQRKIPSLLKEMERRKFTDLTIARNFLFRYKSKIIKNLHNCFSDGLMYNPVNMKVEDQQRLDEKDIRDKNKKKRYEVRQQVEIITRQDGLAE